MTLIKCDFDGELPRDLEYRIGRLCDQLHWEQRGDVEIRRTRRGWHVIFDAMMRVEHQGFFDVPSAFVVIAQLYMGSDRERELFNAMRVQQWLELPEFWRQRWNVLYGEHVKGVK